MQRVLLFFLISLLLLPWGAKAGQEGHGGDIVVSEFLIYANEVGDSLQGLLEFQLPSSDFIKEYNDAVADTKVSSEDRVYLSAVEVDAINFPSIDDPRIIINRERWLDPRLNIIQRKRLVLHEYLSIMGYDDSNYMLSYILIKSILELEGDRAHLLPFNLLMEDKNE